MQIQTVATRSTPRSTARSPGWSRRAARVEPPVYLAIDERDLAPVGLDVDAEPHVLVFGDSQSGKSGVLRGYVHEVMRTRTPEQAQIFTVDYRRSLLGEVCEDYHVVQMAWRDPAL